MIDDHKWASINAGNIAGYMEFKTIDDANNFETRINVYEKRYKLFCAKDILVLCRNIRPIINMPKFIVETSTTLPDDLHLLIRRDCDNLRKFILLSIKDRKRECEHGGQ